VTGRLFLLLCGIAAPAAAQAQAAPPANADQGAIVVTGRGLSASAGDVAYDVVTIGRDRLSQSPSDRLEDILLDVPGFQLFRRSDARSANPTSQGATLRALGGNASSRALIVLDGVPQTDPFGGWVSWPAFDPQRLGEVRVTRGGGSGIYGPGALAGTIELESASPADLTGLRAGLDYGSRDSIDAHAGIGASLGAGFVTLSGAYARGDGFVPVIASQRGPADRPSPYRQLSIAGRAVAPLPGGVELQANLLAFDDERERGTALSGISTTGADASLRLVARRWSALAYLQSRAFANSFASANAARTAVTQTSDQYQVPSTGIGGRFEFRPDAGPAIQLRLGGDWRRTQGETDEKFAFVAGAGTRGRAAGGRSDDQGAFAEASWTADPVTLTAAGRIDHWTIADGFLREHVLATGAPVTDLSFPDRSGWEPTGRAGIALRPLAGLALRGAAYLGWRLPTLNELYRPFRQSLDATANNPALEPERLKGVEAGLDWRPAANAKIGLTVFANRLENAIANVTLGQGPGTFPIVGNVAAGGAFRERENIDAIRARGIELDGRIAFGRFTLSGGWSLVAARVEASGAAAPLDGLRPAQTPRQTFAATFAWRAAEGASASLTARAVSGQYEDDLNKTILPSAVSFDAAILLPLGRKLALEARVENLGDRQVDAGISDGIVERATPRTLWIGLRFGRLK
jgi:vitamin B12 transporter